MAQICDSPIRGSAFDPHPQPQNSLLRILRPRPGIEWKFLLRRTWSGQSCSHCSFWGFHCLSKQHQVSLVRTLLSDQDPDQDTAGHSYTLKRFHSPCTSNKHPSPNEKNPLHLRGTLPAGQHVMPIFPVFEAEAVLCRDDF